MSADYINYTILVFALGFLSLGLFKSVRDSFFTEIYTYTYGFTYTNEDGHKAFSEMQTMALTHPKDISFFTLAQQSIREKGYENYRYVSDPNFQLAYAMYLNSSWRRTSVLLKAQEAERKKKAEREEPTLDELANSAEAA